MSGWESVIFRVTESSLLGQWLLAGFAFCICKPHYPASFAKGFPSQELKHRANILNCVGSGEEQILQHFFEPF